LREAALANKINTSRNKDFLRALFKNTNALVKTVIKTMVVPFNLKMALKKSGFYQKSIFFTGF
jgi:hypothetical protein